MIRLTIAPHNLRARVSRQALLSLRVSSPVGSVLFCWSCSVVENDPHQAPGNRERKRYRLARAFSNLGFFFVCTPPSYSHWWRWAIYQLTYQQQIQICFATLATLPRHAPAGIFFWFDSLRSPCLGIGGIKRPFVHPEPLYCLAYRATTRSPNTPLTPLVLMVVRYSRVAYLPRFRAAGVALAKSYMITAPDSGDLVVHNCAIIDDTV